jgi:hypothetical protein
LNQSNHQLSRGDGKGKTTQKKGEMEEKEAEIKRVGGGGRGGEETGRGKEGKENQKGEGGEEEEEGRVGQATS